MKNIINNIIGSYKHIPYTWKHYLAFLRVEKKLSGVYKYTLLPWLGVERINKIHRKYQSHHPRVWKKNIDFLQAVIDWECARYTKPDKPLNARETMEKFYPEYKKKVEPILEELGL